jgi:hypothetical protein
MMHHDELPHHQTYVQIELILRELATGVGSWLLPTPQQPKSLEHLCQSLHFQKFLALHGILYLSKHVLV